MFSFSERVFGSFTHEKRNPKNREKENSPTETTMQILNYAGVLDDWHEG